MRIARTPLARLLAGGFALATATALVLPSVAAAADDATISGSSALSAESGSSSGSLDKLPIPGVQDFVTALQKVASGKINLESIDACVRAQFGKEDLTANPIEIFIGCVISADEDKDKNDKTDEENTGKKTSVE